MSLFSSRRVLIVAIMLVVAVGGALLRHFSVPQSTSYYVGTMLMVMWVPIVGNIIAFVVRKIPLPTRKAEAPPVPVSDDPHVVVDIRLSPGHTLQPGDRGEVACLFVIGTEGYSVRIPGPQDGTDLRAESLTSPAQFLSPAAALPKFPIGTRFRLVQGQTAVGTGHVTALAPTR